MSVDWRQSDPVELLKAMVRFPSLSLHEKPLVDWLETSVRATGLLEVERYGDNLVFSLGEGRPWLFLNSHTDVVPPSPSHIGDPFEPVVRDGKLYGRGSVDAKGSGTAMLRALVELAAEGCKPEGRISVALTVCEETAGHNNGMHHLRHHVGLRPDAAVVGEPTGLAPCIAQKGLLLLTLQTSGESGHAARVTGPNAIYSMAEALTALRSVAFAETNPFLGGVKITPTMITGGTANNAHPEAAEVVLDVRTIPDVPNGRIVEAIRTATGADVRIFSDRFIAVQTDPASHLARLSRQVTGKEFFGSPTASDWVFLADVPCMKLGPGDSAKSHTADEHIPTADFVEAIAVYKAIMIRYFQETP
jgi:acetylornithine deacetylase